MTKPLLIRSADDIEAQLEKIKCAARDAHKWIADQTDDPMAFLKSVKFEKRGYHPVDGHSLNLIEQVNQTWTYAVALEATRWLIEKHPDAEGFLLAPGATMSQKLDIMSVRTDYVGAETFAATSPSSNGKLLKDLRKLTAIESVQHRYVFFSSPGYGHFARHAHPNYPGVQVISLEI